VIAGNVYEFDAVNQRGETVSVATGQRVTMLFRGPSSLPSARIERYADGVWSPQETDPAGVPDMYTTLVNAFGVYALVAPSGWRSAGVRGAPTATPSATFPSTVSPLVSSGGSGTPAAVSFAPTPPVASAEPEASGGASSGGSPPGPIVAVVIVLAVVAAAAVVLLRPVKPPSD
jgi:hypothetical protein